MNPGSANRICDATLPHLEPLPAGSRVLRTDGAPLCCSQGHPALQMEIGGMPAASTVSPARSRKKRNPVVLSHRERPASCWENQRSCKACGASCPTNRSKPKPCELRPSGRSSSLVIDADDQALTCAGTDLSGRQIEWSTTRRQSRKNCHLDVHSRWTTMADEAYKEITTLTVFLTPAAPTRSESAYRFRIAHQKPTAGWAAEGNRGCHGRSPASRNLKQSLTHQRFGGGSGQSVMLTSEASRQRSKLQSKKVLISCLRLPRRRSKRFIGNASSIYASTIHSRFWPQLG